MKKRITISSSCTIDSKRQYMATKNQSASQLLIIITVIMFSKQVYLSLGSDSDTIYSGQTLSGTQTLTSQGLVFELGFFKPGKSQNYYIGIWYKKTVEQVVVWVANREHPVSDPSLATLKLSENGRLSLVVNNTSTSTSTNIWSSGDPRSGVSDSTVIGVLLDSGNFVLVRDHNQSALIWQSFDHPTDTWLPGGKIGYNKLTNERIALTSCESPQNPAPGAFSVRLDQNGSGLMFLRNESETYWRVKNLSRDFDSVDITYITDKRESYFTFTLGTLSREEETITGFKLEHTGQFNQYEAMELELLVWTWQVAPSEQCFLDPCGDFQLCNPHKTPRCSCLEGFEIKSEPSFCMRMIPLGCETGRYNDDKFMAVPDVLISSDSEYLAAHNNADECRLACLGNCSCSAYAYYSSQCQIWTGSLFRINQRAAYVEIGQTLYVRVGLSRSRKSTNRVVISVVLVSALAFLLAVATVFVRRRYIVARKSVLVEDSLVLFRYRDLKAVTKGFSNKLGEGGFGCVFKGTMPPKCSAVAVKKLKCVMQEEKQFRAEVMTLGTVNHANLVRLRGFCVENSKRFLVYDYMPNGSLDSLLFQKSLTNVLDWNVRYRIAVGIARGLEYLHEECLECIIHCDIKPENILLDLDYKPKLADFRLAKLMGRDFSRVLTTVRGTIGYLAPEWISGEPITPKADVFSYGMLLFELITGRRNGELLDEGMEFYFPYRVANSLKLEEEVEGVLTWLDPRLEGNADNEEVVRACKVACWCIQDDEKSRPSMKQVVQILTRLVEVGVPPVSRFIQRLIDSPIHAFNRHETSASGSDLSPNIGMSTCES